MPSILDAFSGCGGISLGAHQAGFSTALAVDIDPILSGAFRLNFPAARLLQKDIRGINTELLDAELPNGVDGVVGGPPCQAFSEIGRKEKRDPRRHLVREFFRIVCLVKPKFFLFENVRGLGFEKNVGLLESALELLPSSWEVLGPHVLNAADFGAPTSRKRLFVFGFDKNEMNIPAEARLVETVAARVSVREAIADLATASVGGVDPQGFDVWKYDGRRSVSHYADQMRSKSGAFTGHHKTIHTRATLKRFAALGEGEVDEVGRYPRLSWEGLCPTLRAGTGNDRGSYQAVRPIHPELDRVITPREAARLQGFPDSFLFHPTVWHSCRMIGNSVSPIVAKVLLQRIGNALENQAEAGTPLAAE